MSSYLANVGGGAGIPGGRVVAHRPSAASTEAFRRRSSALLELDEGFQHSIQRAADALSASRLSRVEVERRMERGRTRSAHFVETEVRGHERGEDDAYTRYLREGETKRRATTFASPSGGEGVQSASTRNPNKLKTARSIPINMHSSSPSPDNDDDRFDGPHDKDIRTNPTRHYATISPTTRPYSASDSPSARVHEPRRAVSYAHLPSVTTHQRPSILQNTGHSTLSPLPLYLPVPTEPPSKFSASTGNSRLSDRHRESDEEERDPQTRSRSRTPSHVHSIRNLLKSTPSKLSLRKKGSFANLFGAGGAGSLSGATGTAAATKKEEKEDKAAKVAEFKARLASDSPAAFQSRIPTAKPHTASTNGKENAESSPASSRLTKKTPHGGFLRNALRDLTGGTQNRPAGLRDSNGSSDAGRGTHSESSSIGGAKAWVGKLGRAVSGRRAPAAWTPPTIVRLADKVELPVAPAPVPASRLPSRIPISSIFPDAHTRRQTGAAPKLRPRAVYSPTPEDLASPSRPTPAILAPLETFIPHARLVVRRANLPPASTEPITLLPARATTTSPVDSSPNRLPAPKPAAAPSRLPFKRPVPPPQPTLLPAAELRPAFSRSPKKPGRLQLDNTGCLSVTSSSEEDHAYTPPSPSPNRRSFRSPSAARFRGGLLPSPSASSSPEKNGLDLPAPSVSPKSDVSSPRKRAMGPEQIIEMEAAHLEASYLAPEAGISEVCGATSDLADLLSALDDTADLTRDVARPPSGCIDVPLDVQDLSASLRQYLPHTTSIESLRSTVSDVPDDLRLLIQSVSNHISEVNLHLDGKDDEGELFAMDDDDDEEIEEQGEVVEYYEGEDEREDGDAEPEEDLTDELVEEYPLPSANSLSVDYISASNAGSSTVSSFEGHVTTAAMALRSMLDGPAPGQKEPRYTRPASVASFPAREEDEEERAPRNGFRDSLQEYLAMERPTIGDKMMDRMDIEVSLTSLVDAHSPPPSPEQTRPPPGQRPQNYRYDSSESSSGTGSSLAGSPTPANGLRRNIMRYSQDSSRPHARPFQRPESVQSQSSSGGSESDIERPPSPPADEQTNMSLAQSTRSTNLSISSLNSSPCPLPRRRIPMLGRNVPPGPVFRFPPPSFRGRPPVPPKGPLPWTTPHGSTSPERSARADRDSPFKKAFNPLEQFRMKSQRKGSSEDVLAPVDVKAANVTTSPRFVRSLHPSKIGAAIPRPRPLSSSTTTNALIPPDTPPPSSPSTSDNESHRSSQSSLSSFQGSLVHIDPPAYPLSSRAAKGHSRQISRASTIFEETIVEEEKSPRSSPTLHRQLDLDLREPFGLATIPEPMSPQPASPAKEEDLVELEKEEGEPSVAIEPDLDGSRTFNLSFSPRDEETDEMDEWSDEEEAEDEFGLVDDHSRIMRSFVHWMYEADTELKRSRVCFPDTEASLEALRNFDTPTDYCDILKFIYDSQNRFGSATAPPSTFYAPSTRPFYLDETETRDDGDVIPNDDPLPPPTPVLSPDSSTDASTHLGDLSLSPPSPTPLPAAARRRILGEKPFNRQLALTQSSSSPRKEDVLSPFTALPPTLAGKLRGLRAKLSPKKTVDVAFLGAKTTKRRKNQWDAARRKLEGEGAASEQRSDEDSDSEDRTESTGVLEAAGEGNAFLSFVKTPKLLTTRPRVRRKAALTHLR